MSVSDEDMSPNTMVILMIIIIYIGFVILTKERSIGFSKENKKETYKLFGIHIDLYIFFIPICIILLTILFFLNF